MQIGAKWANINGSPPPSPSHTGLTALSQSIFCSHSIYPVHVYLYNMHVKIGGGQNSDRILYRIWH